MKKVMFFAAFAVVLNLAFATTPYINKVYDFVPAPGQFINELPSYEVGDTKTDMIKKVEAAISSDNKEVISLGGFGGYVIFGFDHTVVNVPGQYDFKVWGNAMANTSEPGVIMVSADVNNNGIPDDVWYEIAGSEYLNPQTVHDYSIVYYRPANASDAVRWSGSGATSGVIERNPWHTQSYYPLWLNDAELTFTGTQLPHNYELKGNYYYLNAFEFGYADNHPNDDDKSSIKIDWAVDDDGNPANLQGIDFVKVYTGLNQVLGSIGESSTEIAGAEDLHVDASVGEIDGDVAAVVIMGNVITDDLTVSCRYGSIPVVIYSVSGAIMKKCELEAGVSSIDVSAFPLGVYLLKTPTASFRFIKK